MIEHIRTVDLVSELYDRRTGDGGSGAVLAVTAVFSGLPLFITSDFAVELIEIDVGSKSGRMRLADIGNGLLEISGADIDTQNLITDVVFSMPNTTFIFISHQSTFTDKMRPTHTTTLSNGKIMIE